MRLRPVLLSLFLLALLAWGYWSRSRGPAPLLELTGPTMGTTYSIRFSAPPDQAPGFQAGVDSVLLAINRSFSTYMPESLISRLNRSTETAAPFPIDAHFRRVFLASREIYEASGGAFNPAVAPLVDAWGFGPEPRQAMTEARVDSLRALVDFEAFELTPDSLHLVKRIAGARLDFSAIAKGYGVDEVGRYLASRGIEAYFVEIGGEVVTRGQHPEGRPWRVGIDRPLEESTERTLQAIVLLENQGMATSGNYRNFYVVDGQKFAHTIDPATGYPVRSTLLSATVVARDCMTADGFATAAMVMGAEKALSLFSSRRDIEAFFVVSGPDSALVETMTPGFSPLLATDAP